MSDYGAFIIALAIFFGMPSSNNAGLGAVAAALNNIASAIRMKP